MSAASAENMTTPVSGTDTPPVELDRAKLILDDFRKSLYLRETDGMGVISVYRSGVPTPPVERDVEKPSYLKCDEQKPDDRQGRMDAVFCSPTLGAVGRWVLGNFWTGIADVNVREIRIDIDRNYVYFVPAWDAACDTDEPDDYRKYWDTGMTVREYIAAAQADPIKYDPSEYELLVAEEDILYVERVSADQVAHAAYDNRDILMQLCNAD